MEPRAPTVTDFAVLAGMFGGGAVWLVASGGGWSRLFLWIGFYLCLLGLAFASRRGPRALEGWRRLTVALVLCAGAFAATEALLFRERFLSGLPGGVVSAALFGGFVLWHGRRSSAARRSTASGE